MWILWRYLFILPVEKRVLVGFFLAQLEVVELWSYRESLISIVYAYSLLPSLLESFLDTDLKFLLTNPMLPYGLLSLFYGLPICLKHYIHHIQFNFLFFP